MTDDRELAGLDPFALLEREAERLGAFFSGLEDTSWARASRCTGWTIRDVLGHLVAGEDYHRACLDGTVATLLTRLAERGGMDLDSANALGVADYADLTPGEAVPAWLAAGAENRRRFRERGDGTVDSSVGEYPCRWQAFHVASELATHADDISVPVTDDERDERRVWRARFSRFALSEAKPHLAIRVAKGRTVITDGSTTVDLDDNEFIDAVMGRLDETSRLEPAMRELLSTMP